MEQTPQTADTEAESMLTPVSLQAGMGQVLLVPPGVQTPFPRVLA